MADMVSNVLAELDVIADLKTAVSGILVGAEVHLGKTDIPITPETTLATLTAQECDYTGYAAEAATFGDPTIDDLGRAEVIGICGEFRPTASTVTNQAFNAWIENGAGLLIQAWVIEDGPVNMAAITDMYLPTIRLRPTLAGSVSEIT